MNEDDLPRPNGSRLLLTLSRRLDTWGVQSVCKVETLTLKPRRHRRLVAIMSGTRKLIEALILFSVLNFQVSGNSEYPDIRTLPLAAALILGTVAR